MTIRKKIVTVFLTFALVLSLMPFLPVSGPAGKAYAAPYDANFDDGTYIVDSSFPYSSLYIHSNQRLETYDADSTDPDVVEIAQLYDSGVRVRPCGVGEATITFFDGYTPEDSEHRYEILIKVTEDGMKRAASNAAYIDDEYLGYGTTKLYVYGYGGTKIKIKINGKNFDNNTVTFISAGKKAVKLPKVYKVGTKITCERKYSYVQDDDYQKTITLPTKTYKISKKSYVSEAQLKSAKKIKISLENVHKGDVFYLYYKGKKYTKKITANYPKDKGDYTFGINLKNKMGKNSKFNVKIVNKYKQTLLKTTIKLKNGKFWLYGDD